jgi:hypothetical protein
MYDYMASGTVVGSWRFVLLIIPYSFFWGVLQAQLPVQGLGFGFGTREIIQH